MGLLRRSAPRNDQLLIAFVLVKHAFAEKELQGAPHPYAIPGGRE